MPARENGTGTWVRWVLGVFTVVALAVLGILNSNSASADSVKGLDKRVTLLENAFPELRKEGRQNHHAQMVLIERIWNKVNKDNE